MALTKTGKLWQRIGLLVFLNWLTVAGISMHIGGDALNGHVDGEHYYLDSHGIDTEVSRSVYIYSKWHMSISIASVALYLIGACFFMGEFRERESEKSSGISK